MRDIKFRAWDKVTKKMEFFDLTTDSDFHPEDLSNVMQYTGLKDKNGKEIYEGDILSFKELYKDEQFTKQEVNKVVFNNGFFGIDDQTPVSEFDPDETGMTIIGNIYENPELLK